MPERIQLRRTKGWRLPPNTVSVARPGPYGNPYRVGWVACSCRSAGECTHNSFNCETTAEAVQMYRDIPRSGRRMAQINRDLRGKNLACWCKPGTPCHADVLLELANGPLADDPMHEPTTVMTIAQLELARHALGLPNKQLRSYRNRFVAGLDHPDYDNWRAMACDGFAQRWDGAKLSFGGDDLFRLTRRGAKAALVGKETLCLEDFPKSDAWPPHD